MSQIVLPDLSLQSANDEVKVPHAVALMTSNCFTRVEPLMMLLLWICLVAAKHYLQLYSQVCINCRFKLFFFFFCKT